MYICFLSTVCVPISNQLFLFNSIIPSPKLYLLNNTPSTIRLQLFVDHTSLTILTQPNILKVRVYLYILNYISSTILFKLYIFNSTLRLHFSNWSSNSFFILQFSILQLSKMVVLMWTLEMEFALLTSMLESVRNGLRAESGFKKEAWKTAVEDVKKVLKNKREVIVDQLKTKFQWYKTKWKEWSLIKKNSGWGWDDDTELFLASDSEWDLHIKVRHNILDIRNYINR